MFEHAPVIGLAHCAAVSEIAVKACNPGMRTALHTQLYNPFRSSRVPFRTFPYSGIFGVTVDPKEAEAVIAHLMQEAKGSVLDQDFSRFEAICHLPLETGSFDARDVWHTRAQLEQLFTLFVRYYAENGITDTIRKLISMQARGDDVIVCTHESWHITASKLLSNSMTGFTEIQRRGGVWGVTRSYYASKGSSRFDETLVRPADRPNEEGPAPDTPPQTETPAEKGENHG